MRDTVLEIGRFEVDGVGTAELENVRVKNLCCSTVHMEMTILAWIWLEEKGWRRGLSGRLEPIYFEDNTTSTAVS